MKLTRRKALVALVVVGLSAAAAGAGTMALFSDTEQSTGNTVQAGTLDLTTNSSDTALIDVTSDEGFAPGESMSYDLSIGNSGSLNGSLDVSVTNLTDSENNATEPETELGDDETAGELSNNTNVTIFVDYNQNGEYDSGTDVYVVDNQTLHSAAGEHNVNASLTTSDTPNIHINVTVQEDATSVIQTDGAEFDIKVELNQEDDQ